MAKFNIEVELDWMDEEAYSIDDELRQRIVDGVENALLEKATTQAIQKVDKAIADKIFEAEETIQDTVDKFVKTVSEEKIANIMIPIKASSWSSDVLKRFSEMALEDKTEQMDGERGWDVSGYVSQTQASGNAVWNARSTKNAIFCVKIQTNMNTWKNARIM